MTTPTIDTSATDDIAGDTKVCPFCAETIKAAANVCRYCGRDLVPAQAAKKPTSKGGKVFRGIVFTAVVLLALYLLYAVMYNVDRWSSAATVLPTPTLTATEIRSRSVTITYDDLARNTESHVGKIVHFEGRVLQVLGDPQGSDGAQLRVSVEGLNTIYLFYDSGPRVLEGDTINFYATVEGRLTYDAVLGNKVTLPAATVNLLTIE